MASKPTGFKVATPPGGSTPDTLDGDPIDRTYVARFTLGNAALEREVLELFAALMPRYLENLRGASSNKAWRDAAHTIKGSAAAVGARRLSRFAEMAERLDVEALEAGAEGYRDEAITALTAASDEACRYIARLFARP